MRTRNPVKTKKSRSFFMISALGFGDLQTLPVVTILDGTLVAENPPSGPEIGARPDLSRDERLPIAC